MHTVCYENSHQKLANQWTIIWNKVQSSCSLQPKAILFIPELRRYANGSLIPVPSMTSKERDVFYLKLQWISAKEEAEKKKWAEKIKQVLSEQQK